MIVFSGVSFVIVASFWWFKGVAFGIEGPVNEHWGLGWRKVCFALLFLSIVYFSPFLSSLFSH